MLRLLLYLLLPLASLTACNNRESYPGKNKASNVTKQHELEQLQEERQRKTNTPGPDTMSFETTFAHFFDALQASDTIKLQQYIDPVKGAWVIEQPGAVPKMTLVQDLTRFRRHYQDLSFFSLRNQLKTCDLELEPFPAFDCAHMDQGRSGYSKDGCFAWKPTELQQSSIWEYASLSEAEIKKVEAMLSVLQQSVLHTSSSFRFHFGFDRGHWFVYFIDLRIPCSA